MSVGPFAPAAGLAQGQAAKAPLHTILELEPTALRLRRTANRPTPRAARPRRVQAVDMSRGCAWGARFDFDMWRRGCLRAFEDRRTERGRRVARPFGTTRLCRKRERCPRRK